MVTEHLRHEMSDSFMAPATWLRYLVQYRPASETRESGYCTDQASKREKRLKGRFLRIPCYTQPMSSERTYTYTVVLDRDTDAGGFVATCPSLPGLVTEGDSVEEALEMARDAIRGYLESLRKDSLDIPEESEAVVSPVRVALPV